MSRRRRIIDQLREMFPGEWTFDRDACGGHWLGPEFSVTAYSQLAPKHDADDESCVTVYHRDDNGERLMIWNERGPLL